MNPPRILTGNDIALAMELRSEGCHWHHIATGLGVYPNALRRSVRYAEQYGMRAEAAAVCSGIRTTRVQERAAAILAADTGKISLYGACVRGAVA